LRLGLGLLVVALQHRLNILLLQGEEAVLATVALVALVAAEALVVIELLRDSLFLLVLQLL
jgi:hypothetical protein